jgi:hypothetical protein
MYVNFPGLPREVSSSNGRCKQLCPFGLPPHYAAISWRTHCHRKLRVEHRRTYINIPACDGECFCDSNHWKVTHGRATCRQLDCGKNMCSALALFHSNEKNFSQCCIYRSVSNLTLLSKKRFDMLCCLASSSVTAYYWPLCGAFQEAHVQCSIWGACLRAVLHWFLRFCPKYENQHWRTIHIHGVIVEHCQS